MEEIRNAVADLPCCYIAHHDDADGRCAAAIVRMDAQRRNCRVNLLPMQNYSDAVPDFAGLGFRSGVDELWVVDFSFPMEVMDELHAMAGSQFFWFDHHKSVLEKFSPAEKFDRRLICGVRKVGTAACLLVWDYLHAGEPAPAGVRHIADRDVWRFEFGDQTRWFYEGYLQMNSEPVSLFWDRLFDPAGGDEMSGFLINKGGQLYAARMKMLKSYARRLGVIMSIKALGGLTEAKVSVLKMNFPGSGDMGQVVKDLGFDVCWCWVEQPNGDGRLVRSNVLYSDNIDVGAIATNHGGGGHVGAAGWEEFIDGIPALNAFERVTE